MVGSVTPTKLHLVKSRKHRRQQQSPGEVEEGDRSSAKALLRTKRLRLQEEDIHWKQHQQLVGVSIRKRFPSGGWANGTIVSVKKGNAKVRYGRDQQEKIPIGEALEIWRVAYQMFELSPFLMPYSSDLKSTLFRRGRNTKPYSLKHFMALLQDTEQAHGGATLEALEASKLVEKGAHANSAEIYGRMLPGAIDKIFREFMNLKPTDTLVDIGHGIGNSCLQAAYTVGCHTRGIEVHKTRNAVSQVLAMRLEDAAKVHRDRDGLKFTPGHITYRHGDLKDYQHRQFLTKDITHIFFDNFNGVFNGERGNSDNLERYVAAWFAAAPEGTIMITVSPLRSALGCLPLRKAMEQRHHLSLPVAQATDASFYEVEEFDLGPVNDVYSFAEGIADPSLKTRVSCYLYLRTSQRTERASFLCNNLQCHRAQEAIPVDAIHFEDVRKGGNAAVIGGCDCGISDRIFRERDKTVGVTWVSPFGSCPPWIVSA